MSIRDKILANGWCQCAFVRREDGLVLIEDLAKKFPAGARFIVLNQDCDLVHHNLEAEPEAEFIMGIPFPGQIDGNNTYGKNPRRLHILANLEGREVPIELDIANRFSVPRDRLCAIKPDHNSGLTESARNVLRHWIAARYVREAFPDAFENRLRAASNKINKKMKLVKNAISSVYIALEPMAEVKEGETYKVGFVAVMPVSNYENPEDRKIAIQVIQDVAAAIHSCEGIEVYLNEVVSEGDFTLSEMRMLKRWNWDYLSFRMPEGPMPLEN
ncbi:MAG TPA: hypothetical protein VF268_09660 [Gammaproteobacteria bacterium]